MFTRCPRRPSHFFLPPKPEFPRLRCRGQVINIWSLDWGILYCNIMFLWPSPWHPARYTKKPATDDSVLHQTASMHFACQPLHDSYTIFIFVTMMISDVVLISYNIFSKMPTNMHLWDQLEAWYIFLNTQPGQFVIASDECCASCCHFICLLIWKISSSPLHPIKKHTQSLAGTCTQ